MPHIDQANIACGFHAGDHMVMQRTLKLAGEHDVMIGAHPGYSDLAGFGPSFHSAFSRGNCCVDALPNFSLGWHGQNPRVGDAVCETPWCAL